MAFLGLALGIAGKALLKDRQCFGFTGSQPARESIVKKARQALGCLAGESIVKRRQCFSLWGGQPAGKGLLKSKASIVSAL